MLVILHSNFLAVLKKIEAIYYESYFLSKGQPKTIRHRLLQNFPLWPNNKTFQSNIHLNDPLVYRAKIKVIVVQRCDQSKCASYLFKVGEIITGGSAFQSEGKKEELIRVCNWL